MLLYKGSFLNSFRREYRNFEKSSNIFKLDLVKTRHERKKLLQKNCNKILLVSYFLFFIHALYSLNQIQRQLQKKNINCDDKGSFYLCFIFEVFTQ